MAFDEDGDVALDRHYAAHPEDRGANVVIFKFCDDEEIGRRGLGLLRAAPGCCRNWQLNKGSSSSQRLIEDLPRPARLAAPTP